MFFVELLPSVFPPLAREVLLAFFIFKKFLTLVGNFCLLAGCYGKVNQEVCGKDSASDPVLVLLRYAAFKNFCTFSALLLQIHLFCKEDDNALSLSLFVEFLLNRLGQQQKYVFYVDLHSASAAALKLKETFFRELHYLSRLDDGEDFFEYQ